MEPIVPNIETLETEIKKFASELPYWGKYIADRIISTNNITEEDIQFAYNYLLEELKITDETEKNEIEINFSEGTVLRYKDNLLLTKLEEVEGVNALAEKQVIEFNSKLTVLYGINGSGKSGYTRLLKKAFYSKSKEDILPNIHSDEVKDVSAKFTFKNDNVENILSYPLDSEHAEFQQFSVFDGMSVIKYLDQKNEFEFRPSGLNFFSEFNEAIKLIEKKLVDEILIKNNQTDLAILFEGESDIKTLIQSLSADTNIEDLKKFIPFTEEDKLQKEKFNKQHDESIIASANKTKEIQNLQNVKTLLAENKKIIQTNNLYFSIENLIGITGKIKDAIDKNDLAKAEGLENFKTEKIKDLGSSEWKNLILAAYEFAKGQKKTENEYPENDDNCLLCQQPLDQDAQNLLKEYWKFIKSIAEKDAKNANEFLETIKEKYEKLNFELFPNDNTLTEWLKEKKPAFLEDLKSQIIKQSTLSKNIISDINNKAINVKMEILIPIAGYITIETEIDESIKLLENNELSKELEKLNKEVTKLNHKEKFNIHYDKFVTYINDRIWVQKAENANFAKRRITDTEKALSDKYFNQKYIDTFNEECKKLNGNFGIEISRTGSAGKSYRQLKIKGKNPNAILSEGEQKVIAIADFLSEMTLSDINKGIIFDDPVNSLDEKRKSEIAYRLVQESQGKQVIIFTHDLVFASSIISHSKELINEFDCHWIENLEGNPGVVYLRNTPTFEKDYKTIVKADKFYQDARKAAPEQREELIKNGFAALRTSYEAIVVFDLFKGVVQRFEERVSVESLKDVFFNNEIKGEILDSYAQCCRYMEGHLHSDKYAYKKPTLEDLNTEMQRFNIVKARIKTLKDIPIS